MSVLNIDFVADKIKGRAPLTIIFTPIIVNTYGDVEFITFDTGEDFVENNSTDDFVDF